MRHVVPLLFLFLLTAATSVPVRVSPGEPRLGAPFLLTLGLPSEDVELSGIPPLSPFELLEPPAREGGELRLVLVPMRSGEHVIPPFPFADGPSRMITSPPLVIHVTDGVPADAKIAPLKDLPNEEGGAPVRFAIGIAVACVAFSFLFFFRRRKEEKIPPSLDSLRGEALLDALARLVPTNEERDERWKLFAMELHRRRFAPLLLHRDDEMRLLFEYFELAKGEGR